VCVCVCVYVCVFHLASGMSLQIPIASAYQPLCCAVGRLQAGVRAGRLRGEEKGTPSEAEADGASKAQT